MSKNKNRAGSERSQSTLTKEERAELENWTPGWYKLSHHEQLDYRIRGALDGKYNVIVVGTRGVGKTKTVERIVHRITAEENARVFAEDDEDDTEAGADSDSPESDGREGKAGEGVAAEADDDLPPYPRVILQYQSSKANGSKTALVDLLRALDVEVTGYQIRSWTPTDFVERTLQQLRKRGVHVVCIDEAQKIDPDNLELLRHVYDLGTRKGHPVCLVLIGEHALLDNLRATGQLGQRFMRKVEFPRFKRLTSDLYPWHPQLARLKDRLAAKEWRAVAQRIIGASNGTFRRLEAILEEANDLALKLDQPFDEELIDMVLSSLAEEA